MRSSVEVVLKKKTRKANMTKWVEMEDAAMDEMGFGSGRRQKRKVKNMEGLQRQRVLRGGRRQEDADESQVVMLKMDYGGFWRFVTAKKKELEALRS
ncbi:hypothetical protein ACFX12_022981 [Malus domestica]